MTKEEFQKAWLARFALGISKCDIQKYVVPTGNLIWHVFSWELLDSKKFHEGDEAKTAYDNIDKCGAIYIEWFDDDKTRESMCGPYFMKL